MQSHVPTNLKNVEIHYGKSKDSLTNLSNLGKTTRMAELVIL